MPQSWWQWFIAVYLSIGVIVLFAFMMAGALKELPAWRVITSALLWPYVVYIGIRDEMGSS